MRLDRLVQVGLVWLTLTAIAVAQDRPAPPAPPTGGDKPTASGQKEAPPRRRPNAPSTTDAPPANPDAPPREGRGGRMGREPRVPEGVQLTRDVVYATAKSDAGEDIELTMDTAYLKQSDGKPMPAIVYIHGGGWTGGSKEMGLQQSLGLALGGYFTATIDYRLADQAKYPAAVHDCKAAIRFLRANAKELGIDPNRIGVWGHSAGGHLSALLGTSGNSDALNGSVGDAKGVSSAVQCVVDFSGPVDLSTDVDGGVIAKWLGAPPQEKPELAKQASPLTYIDKNDPPVLIIHGSKDNLVNIHQAEMFEKALKDAGVEVEYMPVEGAGHMIAQPRVFMKAAEFFDQHLGGKAAPAIRERMEQARDRGGDDQQPGGDRPGGPERRRGERPPTPLPPSDAPPPPHDPPPPPPR